MKVDVTYFDGHASRPEQGEMSIAVTGQLELRVGEFSALYTPSQFSLSPRLGRSPRVFEFKDGGRAEAADHDSVEALLWELGVSSGSSVHWLESSWKFVVAAILVLVVGVWGTIEYGVPKAAQVMAELLPPEADKFISEKTLASLDGFLLQPTSLSKDRQDKLRAEFRVLHSTTDDRHDFQLEFRESHALGANAFALPSGIIVLLDDLVELAKNDNEIKAVLSHEIGHVVHRHGLRTIMQSSAVVLLISTITGDVFSSSALASLLPVMLVESKYSREFEREADEFALAMMLQHDIPKRSLIDLLERIGESLGHDSEDSGLLSTHPATSERAVIFSDLGHLH